MVVTVSPFRVVPTLNPIEDRGGQLITRLPLVLAQEILRLLPTLLDQTSRHRPRLQKTYVPVRERTLCARAGKNRVEIETPDGRETIDLEASSHFEKSLQTDIDTPHAKFETRHVGPNGNVSYTSSPVRSATHDDLRLVDQILSDRGR